MPVVSENSNAVWGHHRSIRKFERRSVRKLKRTVAARLAERPSTKISIAFIIAVGASSRLAALSVNTNEPHFSDSDPPEKQRQFMKRVTPGEPTHL
jgi:hypothetical protein